MYKYSFIYNLIIPPNMCGAAVRLHLILRLSVYFLLKSFGKYYRIVLFVSRFFFFFHIKSGSVFITYVGLL